MLIVWFAVRYYTKLAMNLMGELEKGAVLSGNHVGCMHPVLLNSRVSIMFGNC